MIYISIKRIKVELSSKAIETWSE